MTHFMAYLTPNFRIYFIYARFYQSSIFLFINGLLQNDDYDVIIITTTTTSTTATTITTTSAIATTTNILQ